jgi:hypothetical protein
VPEWLTLNSLGAVFSIAGAVLSLLAWLAAGGARRAAEAARKSVQARSRAETMMDLEQWTNVFAHAAQVPDPGLFRQMGTELLPRVREVISRFGQDLGTYRTLLDERARRLAVCLEDLAGGAMSGTTEDAAQRLTSTALDMQEAVASATGHLRLVADRVSKGD